MARQPSTLPNFDAPDFRSTLAPQAAPQAPNLSFNPGANVDSNVAQIALQRQQQQQQQNQQSQDNILRTVQMSSQLAQSFVEASKLRQQKDAINAYALAQHLSPQSARVLSTNPAGASEAITKQLIPATPTTLESLVARSVAAGQPTPQAAVQAKQDMQKLPQSQKQAVLLDNKPGFVNYSPGRANTPGQFMDDQGNIVDSSRVKPIPPAGANIAEVRKASLIDKMNKDLPKVMNPANWSSNSPAATSAKLVLNAESAKALADQILKGDIPGNSQSMSILNTDVARVIGQQGVVTNEGRNELQTATGYSKLADAMQYFTDHPEDRKAQAFVQVLKKEMQRQQDLRQKVVDQTMAGNLTAHNELRRMSPQDWEQGLDANGIDVDAAKKGHFKLKPDFVSSLQPTATQSPDIKDAVRKKLGL